MSNDSTDSTNGQMLARAGGNATAAGVGFQAQLGALFATQLLAEGPIDDRLNLSGVRLRSVRFETEAPVDDILIETAGGGWVFVQAKTNLQLSKSATSELGKLADQIVRLWLVSSGGPGKLGWDRELRPALDRILIAVGPGSTPIVQRLGRALRAAQAGNTSALPADAKSALETFTQLLKSAWEKIEGQVPSEGSISSLLNLIVLLPFDMDGADRTTATVRLSHLLEDAASASGAFAILERRCEGLMKERSGSDAVGFRQTLASAEIPLLAAPSFVADVGQLRRYSERIQSHLIQYEETRIGEDQIKIDRPCSQSVIEAALQESLLLVGEPGAGKSAVISAAAGRLRDQGHDVVELAVDRLPVESVEGLRQELGLTQPLRDVLANWPGEGPAFLFIDALDATRGGSSDAVFRTLISDVLGLPNGRWRIVASIRSFDLRLGEQFRELFRGSAPDRKFADEAFPDVRHIQVPPWSGEELDELLRKAPRIATALQAGGERLRDLALVPFNTRLLADLLTGGLEPAAFGQVTSQVDLLKLYWRHRVEKHGTAAELCLEAVVSHMIDARRLSAPRLQSAQVDPSAFDSLLRERVLVLLKRDQFVAFRHHILFDYSASRLYLRPDDLDATVDLLERNRGLGLMLAPALAFALHDLWADTAGGHLKFWQAVSRISGDAGCDPIARSVAARMASELPADPEDIGGLLACLEDGRGLKGHAITAFRHAVGALGVRADDKQPIRIAPWSALAERLAPMVGDVIWPLRTLLYLLLDREASEPERAQVGVAARALLRLALDRADAPSQLSASAIDFVAATYATDPTRSRDLLQELFATERFRERADQEMPTLTRRLKSIAAVDPEFVVEIYQILFGRRIDDTSRTSMGNSQILPLMSNRRQDYDMARYSLKEFFPRFLTIAPIHALSALIGAMKGHAALEHPIQDETAKLWTVSANGRSAHLRQDLSHIWAWNPDEGHADNALAMVQAFVRRLREAEPADARSMGEYLIAHNELALLWARMLLVAAERPDVVGDLLWPFVTQEAFLQCVDTRKDAIDFIAARYPSVAEPERARFENSAREFDFADYSEADRARGHFLAGLFGRIGASSLATEEARQIARAAEAPEQSDDPNPRPYFITEGIGSGESHWWLRRHGVDVESPANAKFLAGADAVKSALGLNDANVKITDVADATSRLAQLRERIATAPAAVHLDVIGYAEGVISQGVIRICRLSVEQLRAAGEAIDQCIPLIDWIAISENPETTEETEASFERSQAWGSPAPRIEAAEAIMNLCRLGPDRVDYFQSTMERLLGDPHPGVRLQIAERLVVLWTTNRPLMWALANRVGRSENNRGVLAFFCNYFLGRTVHHGTDEVEELTFILLGRDFPRGEKPTERLVEELGSLVCLLWISHGRPQAKAKLNEWLADAPTFEAELGHAIATSREALVLGYRSNEARDAEITRRAQEFASWTVEATATGLKDYLTRAPGVAPSEAEKTRGTMFAKLLNQMMDQLYFASGAFRDRQGEEVALEKQEAKAAFFRDTREILHRIGDVGTPGTIHHLIELLEFLVPAAPTAVFDLVAHALLGAGKEHGYQFESLGVDRFVAVIGRFLADYRDIFRDEGRRQSLIACLDVFMDAGWPAARRLVYRLPELLQ